MSERIQSNTTERVYFTLLDSNGDAVTGLAPEFRTMLVLMRKSDGKYYDGDSWEDAKTDLVVTEQDAVNIPGLHFFDTPSLAEDEYVVTVNTANAANVPQTESIKSGEFVDDIDVAISSRASQADMAAVKAKTDNLPEVNQKNVAFSEPFQFLMEDANGNPLGGLTVTGVKYIDGVKSTITTQIDEVTAPNDGDGYYKMQPTAADTNGDHITYVFSASGAVNASVDFWTTL